MRVANLAGRLVLKVDEGVVDVETASAGAFSADPQAIYEVWSDFRSWAGTLTHPDVAEL